MSKKRAAEDSDYVSIDYDSEAAISNHEDDHEPFFTTTNARIVAQMTSFVLLHCLTCCAEWPSDLAGQHGFGNSTGPCPRTGLHKILTGPLPKGTPAPVPIATASPTGPLQPGGKLINRRTPNARRMSNSDRATVQRLVKRYDSNDLPLASALRLGPEDVAIMIEEAPNHNSAMAFAKYVPVPVVLQIYISPYNIFSMRL